MHKANPQLLCRTFLYDVSTRVVKGGFIANGYVILGTGALLVKLNLTDLFIKVYISRLMVYITSFAEI